MGTSDNILFSSHYIFPILINSLKSAIIAINCKFFSIMAPDETWAVQLKIQTICINLCIPRKTSIIGWQSWLMFYCGYSFSVLWPIIWDTVESHWISLLMTPWTTCKDVYPTYHPHAQWSHAEELYFFNVLSRNMIS